MSRRTSIYPYAINNRKNSSGIIPDKMEIGINIKSFNVTSEDYHRLKTESYQKKVNQRYEVSGRSYVTFLTVSKVAFKVVHSFVYKGKGSSFIQSSVICTHLNGNDAYRNYFDLGKPVYLSTDGKSNFATHEEVQNILKLTSGLSRYDFMLNVLPELIYGEISGSSFRDACHIVVHHLKALTPKADVKTKELENNTYSFRYVEMANDIKIPKVFSCWAEKDGNHVYKTFDPNTESHFLENLCQITSGTKERDWVTSENWMAASEVSYRRGRREILFDLYDKNLPGHCYVKYDQGLEYDVFRIEPKYTSHLHGNKSDIIGKICKRKSFNSAEDIRDIFYKLAKHCHQITSSLFDCHYDLLTEVEKGERTKKILERNFKPKDVEIILNELLPNRYKLTLDRLSSQQLKNQIVMMAKDGIVFAPPNTGGKKPTGEYCFKRSLLGNIETRKDAELEL